jgi:hypothetical protein
MGLGNSTHAIFLNIFDGKIVRRVPAPTASSKERKNKNQQVVHEEFYDHITGIITDMTKTHHDEYGDFWNVNIFDTDEKRTYVLQMNFDSSYATGMIKSLPNADLSKELTLIPNQKIVDGIKKTTMFVSQNGKALKRYFTKETPNGLPQPKEVEFKGKMTWDYFPQLKFLERVVLEKLKPKFRKDLQAEPIDTKTAPPVGEFKDPIDDLPF